MIDRQFQRIVIYCDSCDEQFEGEQHEEFQSVWHEPNTTDGKRGRSLASGYTAATIVERQHELAGREASYPAAVVVNGRA